MSYQYEEEDQERVEMEIETSEDGKRVVLTFNSTISMNMNDLKLAFDSFIEELINPGKEH